MNLNCIRTSPAPGRCHLRIHPFAVLAAVLGATVAIIVAVSLQRSSDIAVERETFLMGTVLRASVVAANKDAGVAAIEAVFPAAEMEILYPDLLKEKLSGHKVNYVLISTREESNFYVDISETIGVKIQALRRHVSQLGDWDPEPRVREWAAAAGEKGGCQYAEPFRRIILKELETKD